MCRGESSNGITLTIDEGSFGFCGREHYLAWRETKRIAQMHKLTAAGEQAYSEMYDSYSPIGPYSDAKGFFRSAMGVASELGLTDQENCGRSWSISRPSFGASSASQIPLRD